MDKSSSEMEHNLAALEPGLNGRLLFYAVCDLFTAIALFKLLFYRSSEPWILGLYSLPYFVFLVFTIGATGFVVFLFHRFQLKALYILIASAVVFVLSIATIELGGQIYALIYPSYRV